MTEPIRSVLVASDLQAASRPIVDFAGKLARAADARLFLLHVVEPKSVAHLPRHAREVQLERSRSESEQALELQAAELEEAGTRVYPGHVVNRPAHEVILERLEGSEADVVVVGSAAREGLGHRLGSTADRLLRSSPVPCLIVRGRAAFPVATAAVATDFSRYSRRAARVAAPLLELLGEGRARLDLLHAADRSYLALDPALEGWTERELEREVDWLAGGPNGIQAQARLCSGHHPVDAILQAAEAEGYQLLIAGTHGHGRVRRALIGSVAMGLAQRAPCPVLIVPPRASR